MTTLIALLAIANAVGQSDIQGTWVGTGRHARFTAVFCEDILAMRVGTDPVLETQESRFRIDQEQGTIDIERADGLQLGRFAVDGNLLTLLLADVNLPRPATIEIPKPKPNAKPFTIDRKTWKPSTQQRFVFEQVK